MDLNKEFWDAKYEQNKTGWDIGEISTPIKTYINQINNTHQHILIPGAGNGHEVEYLFYNGFKNISVLDISKQPLENLKSRLPKKNNIDFIHSNFFDINLKFDLIIEQTFFCALDPKDRENYVNKMYDLLNTNGKLVGLLFDFELTNEGPPFGGSIIEYIQLFYAKFNIKVFEKCYNSIKPREGRELFFIFEKK
jgi:thiopurine S-methyltransferase